MKEGGVVVAAAVGGAAIVVAALVAGLAVASKGLCCNKLSLSVRESLPSDGVDEGDDDMSRRVVCSCSLPMLSKDRVRQNVDDDVDGVQLNCKCNVGVHDWMTVLEWHQQLL